MTEGLHGERVVRVSREKETPTEKNKIVKEKRGRVGDIGKKRRQKRLRARKQRRERAEVCTA